MKVSGETAKIGGSLLDFYQLYALVVSVSAVKARVH